MGLIKAIGGAIGGVLADQWKEYFYCEALPMDILVTKGKKRTSGRSSNYKGEENIISNGSVIAVNDGQCMLIVEQGKVVELCAEPGEYKYDTSTEPSIFAGSLGKSIIDTFKTIGKRFTYGGDTGKDQRVYFFNLKEIMGNKYGTANPVPFRVVDKNIGMDMDVSIRCHGEYSYKITNPMLFYTNVCGNISDDYTRDRIDSQLKSELLTALQPAFAKISAMGVRYSSLPGHTTELAEALNDELSEKWGGERGLEVASFGISSVKAPEEDEELIKELQRNAVFRNPQMAAAHLVGAQAEAMQAAASNEGAGAAMAFMGMNMAQGAGGINANQLYAMGQQQADAEVKAETGWKCACGHAGNTGSFCSECGQKKPEDEGTWKCACGAVSAGKFCPECGAKRPGNAVCPKCGAKFENTPKFCSECGHRF
ncbi:MAG: SPFH domain-containing protein [Clostridia bacterium]|nr:SPFH domain-containing protein [Clostridia bacterium]